MAYEYYWDLIVSTPNAGGGGTGGAWRCEAEGDLGRLSYVCTQGSCVAEQGGSVNSWKNYTSGSNKVCKYECKRRLLTELVSDTLQAKWNILKFVSDTINYKWNVRATLSKTIQYIWNVRTLVNKTLQPIWNVLVTVNDTLQAIFNVRALVSKANQFIWDVFTILYPTAKTIKFLWHGRIRRLRIEAKEITRPLRMTKTSKSSLNIACKEERK